MEWLALPFTGVNIDTQKAPYSINVFSSAHHLSPIQVGRDIGANSFNVTSVRQMFQEALKALDDGQKTLSSSTRGAAGHQHHHIRWTSPPEQPVLQTELRPKSDIEKWAEVQRDGQNSSLTIETKSHAERLQVNHYIFTNYAESHL